MPVSVAVAIELSDDERAVLEGFTRRRRSAHGLAQRSRIVLEAADGRTNTEIAERLRVSRPTVTRWRRRFAERRVDGLVDEPRPGRPRTITDEQDPGRKRMFFCAERDVHEGSLRAVMLPELPAPVRRANAGLKGKPMALGLVRRDIIKGEVLDLHRR